MLEDFEENHTNASRCEVVILRQPNGHRRVNANHPGKIQEVIDIRQKDRYFGDGNDRTHQRLRQASLVNRLCLLSADEALDTGATWYDPLGLRDRATEERFLQYENNGYESDCGENRTQPESPSPSRAADDEGRNERAEIRTGDYWKLNVINGARMLMEEEQVLDPHESSTLADWAEKAIDDAGGKVALKRRRGRWPGTRCKEDGLKEKGDGQAAGIVGQSDNEKSTGADCEDVAHDCPLDGSWRHVPLSVVRSQSFHLSNLFGLCTTHMDCGIMAMIAVPPV